jgi:hypothetical protein
MDEHCVLRKVGTETLNVVYIDFSVIKAVLWAKPFVRRTLTTNDRISNRARLCDFCGGEGGTERSFSLNNSVCRVSSIPQMLYILLKVKHYVNKIFGPGCRGG